MQAKWILGVVLSGALAASAFGDIVSSQMSARGFTVVANDVGTTGATSSYHGLPMSNAAYSSLPTFGAGKVTYPGGVGAVPSPGGNTGRLFDLAGFGYKIDGDNITFAVASGLDPRAWATVAGYGSTKFGVGDLFLDVQSNGSVQHFALLNNMNNGLALGHGGYFDAAQSFRNDSAHGVGELVKLGGENDVQLTGGSFGYVRGGNSPAGLDERAFAKGGTGQDVGTLAFDSFVADQPLGSGAPMTWFVSEWTVPISSFGSGPLEIAFHMVPICGNDQIGGRILLVGTPVPAPGALLLAGLGLGLVNHLKRRFA